MNLRTGFTTGACAAAASKAAATLLCEGIAPVHVDITFPDGRRVPFPVVRCTLAARGAQAAVCKDAGDDPDVTHQALIVAEVAFAEGDDVRFTAGEGVGTVTKPGLSVALGEPAINPAPRQMIRQALREVTRRGLQVTVSIPGGRALAVRTFNPRLGIEGGLSILGTTGIVKPFSVPALMTSLQCTLDVAAACGVRAPVLVPGNIGERSALRHFRVEHGHIVQVSNHWGFMLDQAAREPRFDHLLVLGHPGKLAKLAADEWDTHSSSSSSAVCIVARMSEEILGEPASDSTTVEGLFALVSSDQSQRLGNALAVNVRKAIAARIGSRIMLCVVLVNMAGDILGTTGDQSPWK